MRDRCGWTEVLGANARRGQRVAINDAVLVSFLAFSFRTLKVPFTRIRFENGTCHETDVMLLPRLAYRRVRRGGVANAFD